MLNPFRVGEIKGNKKGREREGEIEFQKEIQIFLVASDIKLEERVAGRTLFTSLPVRNKSVFFISGAGTGLGRWSDLQPPSLLYYSAFPRNEKAEYAIKSGKSGVS